VVARAFRYGLLALLLAAVPGAAEAQQVTARAWVDSTAFLVGDYITVHLDLTHPAGARFRLLIGDTLSGFHVIERGTVQPAGETASTARLVVARYDSGRALLPPLPLQYVIGADTAERTVATNALLLTIRTVPVDTAQEIRDIKPPMSIPFTLAEILIFVGILAAVVAAVILIVRHRRRKPSTPASPVYIPPARPAHVIALEELGGLKEKHLWQQGLVKAYYSELTEIVRRYFENRFRFLALEQTTEEIASALERVPGTESVREETLRVLRLADLVKFAKFQPGPAEHDEAMRVAYDIIQKTIPAAAPAGPPAEEKRHVAA
jgi:hypothetical protein